MLNSPATSELKQELHAPRRKHSLLRECAAILAFGLLLWIIW